MDNTIYGCHFLPSKQSRTDPFRIIGLGQIINKEENSAFGIQTKQHFVESKDYVWCLTTDQPKNANRKKAWSENKNVQFENNTQKNVRPKNK